MKHMKMNYKLFISSAGIGSRLKAHTEYRNKGLVTLGLKPAISHIIEKFHKDVPIVIAVGYKKATLMEVVNEAYPDRDIEFVTVENYDGEGSGLGHSMLCCEHLLRCPFIFIPNDTIIRDSNIDINPDVIGNWVGLHNNKNGFFDSSHYRCVETIEDSVIGILPKGLETEDIYIGLCGVKDHEEFWAAMRSSEIAIAEGECFGVNGLDHVTGVQIDDWDDIGNLQAITRTFDRFQSEEHNILPKTQEALWIFGDRCIKYHNDPNFIRERLERVSYLPKQLLPEIVNAGENFFSYLYAEGKLLSQTTNTQVFSEFLKSMQRNLWAKTTDHVSGGSEILDKFYRVKTNERVHAYLDRFDQKDNIKVINGTPVNAVSQLLEKFDWEDFCKNAVWSHFHGDLHGENVVFTKDNDFKLLDWRQNFGENNLEFGDLYYDLGKILHGFIVRHGIVAQNGYRIEQVGLNEVSIEIENSFGFSELKNIFESWLVENEFDYVRVKTVCALIFLNIAALHTYPYSKFLFLLGQYLLNEQVREA